ncbi:bifunctional adenosylcobinamide kinase/adenosylcobinamide-phosphate guanylyltransferase [Sulfitobacter pacificus]|uniref:Bifunctional adenosylcobalamin biosynthesis protein n=1 Tax=Sulfitobacter pacificus TaxID=1499314 RepID=A0ABQ5VLH9_9RHOB|nr:bifunctional adenosylcobinamide kinase/adenosylcobinamide-phosphate guanylyltransferase [Sulfitobacter pacificus]GLQ27901.1 adenosylcobinamide kinase/adenosylcobinamide phosphate guanyltransferase [Sulfitobacter pacificus]
MQPNATFVLGGAASGKSLWAEELVKSYARPMTYLATGQIFDAEVAAKVEVHKNRRDDHWTTVEEPLDLTVPLINARPDQVILIDCATMWLTNHLMAQSDMVQAQTTLITALRNCPAPWVIVSNEVGHGIVPENGLARQFREAQGRLNIALAAEADLAVQVIAGLPQVLKGTLP